MTTRNQLARIITIHELLTLGFHYSLKDLIRACEQKLGPEYKPSERTMYSDLDRLRNEYNAPLAPKNRQLKPYWYTEDFSLYGVFTKEDAALANEATALLKQVSHLPQFAGLDDVFLKFEQRSTALGKTGKAVIQFEQNPGYTGLKWLTPLYESIQQDHSVLIDYQDFTASKPTRYTVSPYLIREYNNRWFLMGWAEGWFAGRPFPLDRIQNVIKLPNIRRHPDITDWSSEFTDVVGVTRIAENPVETLILRVQLPRAHYVRTKPLHRSQDLIAETATFLDFRYQLRWNNELVAKLLELGPNAELLSPDTRRAQLAAMVKAMAERYT